MKRMKYYTLLFFLATVILFGYSSHVNAKSKKQQWKATIKKTTYDYTGKKVKPKVTVKYNKKTLTKKNFKVKYTKNSVEPGNYKVKISLKGRYKGKKLSGSKRLKYRIQLAAPKVSVSCKEGESMYFHWETFGADAYEYKIVIEGQEDYPIENKDEESNYKYFFDWLMDTKYTAQVRAYKVVNNKKYYSKWVEKSIVTPITKFDMVEKNVEGMDIAYSLKEYDFYRGYEYNDDITNTTIKSTQIYFPIYIKQKFAENFVLHTEYNGICGYKNFVGEQSIPNIKNPEVVSNFSVVYFEEDKPTSDDYVAQSMYKQGYIGYILANVNCLLDQTQNVDICFGKTKALTLTSKGYSKVEKKTDSMYYLTRMFYLEPAYNFMAQKSREKIYSDISKCGTDLTDYETLSAVKYWVASHSYKDYTCWGASAVSSYMKSLDYTYITLFCSYLDEDGKLYNDYNSYYSGYSKNKHCALGHMVTLIFMKPGKYYYCQVQGSGSMSGDDYVFDPLGWSKPTKSLDEVLEDASAKDLYLSEYNSVEELMLGDYGVDINKYDALDWHTWNTNLQ